MTKSTENIIGLQSKLIIDQITGSNKTEKLKAMQNRERLNENIMKMMVSYGKTRADAFSINGQNIAIKKIEQLLTNCEADERAFLSEELNKEYNFKKMYAESFDDSFEDIKKCMDTVNKIAESENMIPVFDTSNVRNIENNISMFANDLATMSRQFIMERAQDGRSAQTLIQTMENQKDPKSEMADRALYGTGEIEKQALERIGEYKETPKTNHTDRSNYFDNKIATNDGYKIEGLPSRSKEEREIPDIAEDSTEEELQSNR